MIAFRRDYHATLSKDRFGDEGRDAIRPQGEYGAFEIGDLGIKKGLERHAFGPSVGVHIGKEMNKVAGKIETASVSVHPCR